ncbi:hypothetical protein [Clostridium niameyense]|uniref:hypothetical protein n=1 Tax=Clostridium niameyense TaxID=1622073 RepID=UPI000AE5F265|nr:hypothetical protein [Clostridium niameyense]
MENLDKKVIKPENEEAMDTLGCNPMPDPNSSCGNMRISSNTVNIYVNCNA